jgi:hypothetical protein
MILGHQILHGMVSPEGSHLRLYMVHSVHCHLISVFLSCSVTICVLFVACYKKVSKSDYPHTPTIN